MIYLISPTVQMIYLVYPSNIDKITPIQIVRNEVVDSINLKIQNKILGEERIYKSIDSMVEANESVNSPFLNSMKVPGVPLHCLRLNIGSPIILLRNLESPRLCNGTRITAKQLSNNIIEAKIM
ncbi:hypothetical protein J437_LFUL011090 [Ladona fulva]|uniref:DNA helicase Pif1-like 2B domain-containing protein n=1 Tax=Ladona fulva TaxID=123851 RepID=A0A8K0K941_LADFU|nr:hypothetical protein J437_LFUL011090 [Ladona fulva]